MPTKLQKILLGAIGLIFYAAVMVSYLLSINGRITFVPGQLNTLSIPNQPVDTTVHIRNLAIHNKDGAYIIFQKYLKSEDSPVIHSQYFKPGDYHDLTISFDNQEAAVK